MDDDAIYEGEVFLCEVISVRLVEERIGLLVVMFKTAKRWSTSTCWMPCETAPRSSDAADEH